MLPSANAMELIEQGKAEVELIRELIDDVLFLSELETGRAVVSLASTRAAPIVRGVMEAVAEQAVRAGVTLSFELDEDAEVPLRPRMLRVVAENLAENAIRYAGDGSRFAITLAREPAETVIVAADDGVVPARRTSSGSSSVSTAPTGLGPHAAPASGSRSSSTSSRAPVARSRLRARRGKA